MSVRLHSILAQPSEMNKLVELGVYIAELEATIAKQQQESQKLQEKVEEYGQEIANVSNENVARLQLLGERIKEVNALKAEIERLSKWDTVLDHFQAEYKANVERALAERDRRIGEIVKENQEFCQTIERQTDQIKQLIEANTSGRAGEREDHANIVRLQERIERQTEQINNLTEELQKYKEENQRLQSLTDEWPQPKRVVDLIKGTVTLDIFNDVQAKLLAANAEINRLKGIEAQLTQELTLAQQKMSFNRYAELAERTESPVDSAMCIRLARCYSGLAEVLSEWFGLSETIDAYKKYIFYAKSSLRVGEQGIYNRDGTWKDDNKVCKLFPGDGIECHEFEPSDDLKLILRLVHGIVGISSESGEINAPVGAMIRDGLAAGLEDKIVNIAEECGDLLWYLALLSNALGETGLWNGGCSLETIAMTNIEKLQKRYPVKFTQNDAVNRNLDAELAVLNHPDIQVITLDTPNAGAVIHTVIDGQVFSNPDC